MGQELAILGTINMAYIVLGGSSGYLEFFSFLISGKRNQEMWESVAVVTVSGSESLLTVLYLWNPC